MADLTLAEVQALPAQAMAGLPLSQSGAYQPEGDVHVRAYPFPYRCALALSNDCDSQSIECMFDWHTFVNGTKATRYGDGLGLEVGDSHWVYGAGVEPALYKGNPFDPSHDDGYALGQIIELGRLGWLDTLHSFGNWNLRVLPPDRTGDPTVYSRDQMQKGLDRLVELGLKPFVYVNHSGSPSNVGGPWGYYQHADDPDHNLYFIDRLREFGFRFFWIDPCTQIDKFGENLEFSSESDLRRALDRYRWASWLRHKDEEGRMVPVDVPDDPAELRELLVGMFNRPFFPVSARDGRMIHAFKRYRDIDQPVGATFPCQVTAAKLDELEARKGNVVVYQHFGVFGPRGRLPAVSRPFRKRSPIPALDEHSVATWEMIADRSRGGRLFVTTQGRLLDWLWRRSALRFSIEKGQDRWVISLDGFDCPVEGRRDVSDADLNGLAFVVPANAPDVNIVSPGRSGSIPLKRDPDPNGTGEHVAYLDWKPLEWPE